MLMLDLHNTRARAGMADVAVSGNSPEANVESFSTFWSGISLHPRQLLEPRWRVSGSAGGGFAYFRAFMHETLPESYDPSHLDRLGGRFCLRIIDVGGFTVMVVLGRVLTLEGLPTDGKTGEPLVHAEVEADIFMALCNELLAELAEATLSNLSRLTNQAA